MTLENKFTQLKENLKQMEKVIIAYSGGVDSTLLLKAASLSGLKDIIAVTSSSQSMPEEELAFAKEMTAALHVEHRIIETAELSDERYTSNPPDRCYYCKKELFLRLKEIAGKENIPFILDGTNIDDSRDWRPGRRAAAETGVRSPLQDAGMNKREIREISRELGLPTWNKPATPCLSSRFPYGQNITSGGLEKVNLAERFLKQYGLKDLRVRVHGETARIEVLPEDFSLLTNKTTRAGIVAHLKKLGFKYITLDLQGFRSGSLNE
jgi:uncharacterized protein